MMQEYEDDFFFEEDKIKPNGNVSNLLLPIEETASVQEITKDVPEIKIYEEQPKEDYQDAERECIFNDLRFERYTIKHQDLIVDARSLDYCVVVIKDYL